MGSTYQKMYMLSKMVKLDNKLLNKSPIARRGRIPCHPSSYLYDVYRIVISGLATNRPERGRSGRAIGCRQSLNPLINIWRPGQLPIGQTAKARSGCRVQSLRRGRDRQCRTYPIHAVSSGLVKIAPPYYTAVGLTKGALYLTRK